MDIFTSVKAFFKISTISTDNWVFKLHYKLSALILFVFSIVVNTRQFFGDPIDCIYPAGSELANYADTYCWMNSYTLVHKKEGYVITGVSKYRTDTKGSKWSIDVDNDYRKVHQTYYQWIGIVLLFQAGLFYLPRLLWKNVFEEGRVKELVTGLQSRLKNEDEFDAKLRQLVGYIKQYRGHHTTYAFKFFSCEVLNFFNVIFQIILTDWFLGHNFLNYGIQWLWSNEEEDEYKIYHPFHRYFPKETYCTIYYGSSGSVGKEATYPARCVLPIHVLNEKIYLFLWFYFFSVAVVSGLFLIYRAVIISCPKFRYYCFQRRAWATDATVLSGVTSELDIGDWFLVYQLMKNMDPFIFSKLMDSIHEHVVKQNHLDVDSKISASPLQGVCTISRNYDIDDGAKHRNLTKGMNC